MLGVAGAAEGAEVSAGAAGGALAAGAGLVGALERLGPELEDRDCDEREWVEWAPEVSALFPTRGGLTLAFRWLMVSLTTENLMTFSMSRRLRVISAMVSVEMERWKKM